MLSVGRDVLSVERAAAAPRSPGGSTGRRLRACSGGALSPWYSCHARCRCRAALVALGRSGLPWYSSQALRCAPCARCASSRPRRSLSAACLVRKADWIARAAPLIASSSGCPSKPLTPRGGGVLGGGAPARQSSGLSAYPPRSPWCAADTASLKLAGLYPPLPTSTPLTPPPPPPSIARSCACSSAARAKSSRPTACSFSCCSRARTSVAGGEEAEGAPQLEFVGSSSCCRCADAPKPPAAPGPGAPALPCISCAARCSTATSSAS